MKKELSMGALIAIYGEKPIELAHLIMDCQSRISKIIGAAFHPYNLHQVHATITSIGQAQPATAIVNRQGMMDIEGLVNFLYRSGILPFQVQIGGFQKRQYPFLSRGIQPYNRAFSLRDGKALIIGWPVRGTPSTSENPTAMDLLQESKNYPTTLDKIRQSAKGFGCLHRYYNNINDFDNDFYFRIGLFDSMSLSEEKQEAVENDVRQFLSDSPVTIEINKSDLYFAFSDKETMPRDTTITFSLTDPNVSASVISQIQAST